MENNVKVAKMPIMEIFGPTIQGEGMVVGRKTMFVRTGGCDYSCSWCDSAFTWNGEEKPTMKTAQEVWDELVRIGSAFVPDPNDPIEAGGAGGDVVLNFNHVTISGGNPALIGQAMEDFIHICIDNDVEIGLETQGSRWKSWFTMVNDLTISPKPPSSGMKTDWNNLDLIIARLRHETHCGNAGFFTLKVVVFDDVDYAYAQEVHQRYPGVPFFLSVGNTDPKSDGDISKRLLEKLDWLWAKVIGDPIMNDARPLPQLHTLVWANRRAV